MRCFIGAALLLSVSACTGDDRVRSSTAQTLATSTSGAPTTTPLTPTTTDTTTAATTSAPTTVTPTTAPPATVTVTYRVERRTTDDATAGFAGVVDATLSDPRGWTRAGFQLMRDDAAEYVIILAEGDEVDALCLPYDTYGQYSCQNGPVVALNADRWRVATPKWTGDLDTYRQMLVSHEVGHLLGQRHPTVQCPQRGRLAAVMSQQSTELNGCLPNPWPLPSEVSAAARHDRPLAPPPDR